MRIKRFCSLLMAAVMGLTMMGCGAGPIGDAENGLAGLKASVGPNAMPELNPDEEPEAHWNDPYQTPAPPSDDEEPEAHAATSYAPAASVKPIAGQIVKASYPETVPYPIESDYIGQNGAFNEAYFDAYEKWMNAQEARPDLTADEIKGLYPFFKDGVKQFLNGAENRVCSPLNIYMALSMLSGLTAGNSQAQILKLLDAKTPEALSAQANRIWNALYTDDGVSSTLLGSSLWLNETVRFNADTLKKVAANFYASSYAGKMGSPEFDAALRAWLNEQTRGLLSEQAGGVSMDPETLLALATTIYFKAKWEDEFSEYATKPDTFHAVNGDRNAPFMNQTVRDSFYTGDGFTAVYKRLRDSGMWLILPDKGKTPADLLNNGAAMDFLSDPDKYATNYEADIELSLPKFDVTSDLDLIGGLKALGVTDVFSAAASDFTPMTAARDDIVIGQAKHAARVKIDEEGCEAAAFTVMMAVGTAMPQPLPKVQFKLDRPFLFAVTATAGLPLFVGAVQTPVDA